MIEIRPYSEDKKEEWDNFIDTSKNPLFMHKRDYLEYHKNRFNDFSLMFYENNKLIALLLANKNGNDLLSHAGLTFGGMILSKEIHQKTCLESVNMLVDYCKNKDIHRIQYKPAPYIYNNNPCQEDIYAFYLCKAQLHKIEPATVIELNNSIPMAKLRKRQMKKARNNGITVCEFESYEDYGTYMLMLNEVLLTQHNTSAVHTLDEIYSLHSLFPENIKLFMASKNNVPLAGSIVYIYEGLVHTQYLAANSEGRKLGALDAVIEYIIEKYSYKKYLDFGISSENNGHILNEGLISQKEGFGGRTVAYVTYKIEL